MQGTSDRTGELFAIADHQCKVRGRAPPARPRPQKTDFAQHASRLGRALHTSEMRTARLAKLACKSSLFDDPAVEIGEISGAVREELAAVATSLDALVAAPRRVGGRQFATHADAVTAWLRSRVTAVTSDFQAALKQREATISAKESRAAKLSGVSHVASPFAAPSTSSNPATPASLNGGSAACGGGGGGSCAGGSGGRVVAKSQLLQRRRPLGTPMGDGSSSGAAAAAAWAATAATPPPSKDPGAHATHQPQRVYHDLGASGFGGSPEPGTPGWADDGMGTPEQLQQRFWTPRSQRHREEEVNAMQSTLAELGTMFQRFGAVVAEQGELISRIDNNVEASVGHIGEAHSQILKYQKNMKGNRGFIIKVFGVLFFIIVIYGTLFRR
jgi:syntaxin 5